MGRLIFIDLPLYSLPVLQYLTLRLGFSKVVIDFSMDIFKAYLPIVAVVIL